MDTNFAVYTGIYIAESSEQNQTAAYNCFEAAQDKLFSQGRFTRSIVLIQ